MASSPQFVAAAESGSNPFKNVMDLESIYTNRRQDILRLLLYSGVNVTEAEDVTQQAFLNAYERPAPPAAEGSLFSWLVTCARNLAFSRYRRSQRELLAPVERWKEWEESIADPGRSILVHLEEQQEYAVLTHVLNQLSLCQQQCILLRSQGYTFEEIAASLNIPRSNAVYAVSAAVRQLQKVLKVADNPDRA
jgi:RNA polymerase sigma factor (sigma-70 family)